MKAATVALREALQEDVSLKAIPKLRVEWEHNRFSKITPVDDAGTLVLVTPENDPQDMEWNSIYSANSIVDPNRPATGIAKARLTEPIKLQGDYRDTPLEARFYAASDSDIYKYWSSSQRSTTEVATADYSFDDPITLSVVYEEPVVSNKVVVGFETSYASPKSYDIQITTNGTSWTTIASNVVPDPEGRVSLWRGSNLSWSSTPSYDTLILLRGVRIVVRSMNELGAHLDVIQIGARLENDLSDVVIQYDRNFEISARSFIAPVGEASSNDATIELSNIDARFNNDNTESIYHGLIGKKARFTLELSYDLRPAGSADERVRQLTMWSDNWGGQDEDSVTVSLKDSSVILQESEMPKVFWECMTVGAIIWQIMDTFGMTNYKYSRDVIDTGQLIPYFWSVDGTAWDHISRLSEGTQTAIWFDEYDVLQIKTRNSLFGPGRTVSWNFDAVQNGPKLPDIVEMSGDDTLVVNKVDINYKPAEFRYNNGFPRLETVWEPDEENVVLRATPLLRDLHVNDENMFIDPAASAYWPYESLINIRGEILRYRGKEYMSHLVGGGKKYTIIYNQEEKEAIDSDITSDVNLSWANAFTGMLRIDERGLGGSGVDNHWTRPAGYTSLITDNYNQVFYPTNHESVMKQTNGYVSILNHDWDANHISLVKHESAITSNGTTYGMKFRWPSAQPNGNNWCTGGLFFGGDWGDAGYYLEISNTHTIDDIEGAYNRHEIRLVVMPGNGVHFPIHPGNGDIKGFRANILNDKWYTVEVRSTLLPDFSAKISVFFDGVFVGDWWIGFNERKLWADYGKWGMFVRGMCRMDVEYLYAVNDTDADLPDTSTFLDLASGGFTSGYIEREWRYGSYWSYNRGPAHEGGHWFVELNSRAHYALDEFGPVVHEIREFEVEFDKEDVPVGFSYPYLSNSSQVVCIDYNSTPFGAKFTLANAIRRDAILKGEDTVTLGEDNRIQQKFFVYGQKLYQDEESTITKTDDFSIRRNGTVSLKFDNQWIQTEPAAEELAQWVVDQWGGGSDEISLEVFGNPLVQLGDLITVNYPAKAMAPATHKYYIVDISEKFNDGLTTSLIIRRARL